MGRKKEEDRIGKDFHNKDILSLDQFTPVSLSLLFKRTKKILTTQVSELKTILAGKIVTLLFFEPSSRTFGSFAAAVKKLGGQTLEFQNPMQTSSVAKGETLEDTVRTFENYCDLIVMRHPVTGSLKKAANAASIPVISGGDGGAGEHPTQALMDLFTIHEHGGRLDNLVGLLAGDMLNGRTVHSLIRGLALYNNITLHLLSPQALRLPREDILQFRKRGIKLVEIESEKDIPGNADFWYWTRVQKERFTDINEYERIKHSFIVTPELLKKKGNKKMVLMHPLPRVGEIDTRVDGDPRAIYLSKQMRNGLYVRMALLSLILSPLSSRTKPRRRRAKSRDPRTT